MQACRTHKHPLSEEIFQTYFLQVQLKQHPTNQHWSIATNPSCADRPAQNVQFCHHLLTLMLVQTNSQKVKNTLANLKYNESEHELNLQKLLNSHKIGPYNLCPHNFPYKFHK